MLSFEGSPSGNLQGRSVISCPPESVVRCVGPDGRHFVLGSRTGIPFLGLLQKNRNLAGIVVHPPFVHNPPVNIAEVPPAPFEAPADDGLENVVPAFANAPGDTGAGVIGARYAKIDDGHPVSSGPPPSDPLDVGPAAEGRLGCEVLILRSMRRS